METHWKDSTSFAKANAILMTILSLATFSCGVNWVLVFRNFNSDAIIKVLFILEWIEFVALILSLVGLALIPAIQALSERARRRQIAKGSYDEPR